LSDKIRQNGSVLECPHFRKDFDMTLSQTFKRSGALFAAILTSGTLLFGAPAAHAVAQGPHYKVQLVQPAPVKKMVIRGVVFQCEDTVCKAPIASSAPKNMCASVARELGEVAVFNAGDRQLTAEDMASCNAKKKTIIAGE
jgi:hypothetical protein